VVSFKCIEKCPDKLGCNNNTRFHEDSQGKEKIPSTQRAHVLLWPFQEEGTVDIVTISHWR
jgi:hypothetical protein